MKDAANDTAYWTAVADDAEGHVTSETLGNGLDTRRSYNTANGKVESIRTGAGALTNVQNLAYLFDPLGNLKERTDHNQSLTESFVYDDLNRLKEATIASVGTRNYAYDDFGNIKQKADFGDDYSYGEGTAGPHAVTKVQKNGQTLAVYTYDANGNMTGGDDRNIIWNSFNKPVSISKGTTTIAFDYDADHSRIKKTNNGVVTYYFGPRVDSDVRFEKEVDGAVSKNRHYIFAGGQPVAIYTTQSSSADKTRYLHRDHLGSTDVITDENGGVVERLSFDAFGSRRDANWIVVAGVTLPASQVTDDGFTGHEQLDDVGIVHMNGRLYDSKLGRFLSADIQVQYPENTQSYNRYSYVHNNPLSYTDPSGYGVFSDIIKIVVVVVLSVITYGVASGIVGGTAGVFAGAAAGGFVGGFVASGGDLRAGGIGALTGLAFAGVGQWVKGLAGSNYSVEQVFVAKTLSHGAVGGLSSKLQGEKFITGLLSGAFTAASGGIKGLYAKPGVNVLGNTIKAAIVGGAASVIGGGKFANGAITGAFSRLFNSEASGSQSGSGKPSGDFVQARDPSTGKLIWVHRSFSNKMLMQSGRPSGISQEQIVNTLDNTVTVFGAGAAGFGAAGQLEIAIPAAGVAAAAQALRILIEPPTRWEFGTQLIDQAGSIIIPNPAGKAFFEIVGPAQRTEELSQ